MKTVSGKVVSCQQISLSRAAKYISRFTASDNEASPAFAAYLRRTSAAFNELVQLHKEYKIVPLGESKLKKKDISEVNVDEHSRNVHSASVGLGSEVQNTGDGDVPDHVHGGLKMSKKKKERDGDVVAAKGKHGGDHDVVNEMRRVDGGQEKNVVDVGAAAKKSKNKRARDGDMASIDKVKPNGGDDDVKVSEVKNEIGGLGASEEANTNDVSDVVGGTGKKSKKKRGKDVDVPSIENDQSHDTINPNEVDNKMGSLDASEDLRKKKKKKNKVEVTCETKTHDEAEGRENGHNMETEGLGASEEANTNDVSAVVGGTVKKSKKKRGNNVDLPSIENDQSHDTVNPNEVDNKMGSLDASKDLKKKKKKKNKVEVIGEKKTHDEAEGRENGHNMETEAVGKKESRKRKHERLADEELVESPEAVRSKKKKLKH